MLEGIIMSTDHTIKTPGEWRVHSRKREWIEVGEFWQNRIRANTYILRAPYAINSKKIYQPTLSMSMAFWADAAHSSSAVCTCVSDDATWAQNYWETWHSQPCTQKFGKATALFSDASHSYHASMSTWLSLSHSFSDRCFYTILLTFDFRGFC